MLVITTLKTSVENLYKKCSFSLVNNIFGGVKKENREVKYVNLFILLHAVAFLNPIKF